MASEIAALKADLTVQDPFSVYRWMNACTFEMGKLAEKVREVHARLSKKSIVIDFRLLNLVSHTLVDLLCLKTNQFIVDQWLEGISVEKRTQAVEMLLEGRATVGKYYDPILDSLMQRLEETQIVPRILEVLKHKNLKKCKENYENLSSRYAECLELHEKSHLMRERIATEALFADLQRELGFGSPALVPPSLAALEKDPKGQSSFIQLPSEKGGSGMSQACQSDNGFREMPQVVSLPTSSSACLDPLEADSSESSSEEEEIDSAEWIQRFMIQPQEARRAQFDRLSFEERDSICEIVATLYEMWVPCSETEEELDYHAAEEFLCGNASRSFQQSETES